MKETSRKPRGETTEEMIARLMGKVGIQVNNKIRPQYIQDAMEIIRMMLWRLYA